MKHKSYPVKVLSPQEFKFEMLSPSEKDRAWGSHRDWLARTLIWAFALPMWISVEAALPVPGQLSFVVFQADERRLVGIAGFNPKLEPPWLVVVLTGDREKAEGAVTHWMPVPRLPEEDE